MGGREQAIKNVIDGLRAKDEGLDTFIGQRQENEGMPRPYHPTSWCAWLVNTACVMIENSMFEYAEPELGAVLQLYQLGVRPGDIGEYPKFPGKRFPTFPLYDR